MAVRLNPPGYVYLGDDGLPLDSGKIYTYQTGTTTNKTTYTDAAAGTPNANPVVLDSDGRADIWLDTDVAYRIVVKTSADVTLTTTDNVIGPLDMTGDIALLGDISLPDGKCIEDDSNNEWLCFQKTASAVNYFEMTNAATGNAPLLSVAGSDSSISMEFQVKGSSGDYTLKDHNGNELMTWGPGVTSAVNYVAIYNTATGTGPSINMEGGDTNIDFNFYAKGTGTYNFYGTATSSSELRIFEDTDNGTNYFGLKAAAATTDSVTYTWPAADGTSGAVLVTDGAGGLSWDTGTLASASTQAAMETATDTTTFVSPGRVQYHPGVAKVWCSFTGTGSISLLASHNVDSITDNGTGDYSVTIDTDFSSDNYAYFFTTMMHTAYGISYPLGAVVNTGNDQQPTAGVIRFRTGDLNNTTFDMVEVNFLAFGDQ